MKPIKYGEVEVYKRGVYPGKVQSVDEDEGQFGPQLKFILEFTGGKYQGKTIWAWASPSLTPKSKLTSWLPALMPGAEVGPGFELDPDDLVNDDVEFQIVVGVGPGKDGIERNTVESLLPFDEEEEEKPEPPKRTAPAQNRQAVGAGTRARAPF